MILVHNQTSVVSQQQQMHMFVVCRDTLTILMFGLQTRNKYVPLIVYQLLLDFKNIFA